MRKMLAILGVLLLFSGAAWAVAPCEMPAALEAKPWHSDDTEVEAAPASAAPALASASASTA